MSRRSRILAYAALSTPVLLVVLFLASRLELRPRVREVGLRGAAAENPLLALERMLQELGVECEGAAHLMEAPREPGVLFWRASGRFAPPSLVLALDEWVRDGGHFVLLIPTEDATYDQIRDDIDESRFAAPVFAELGALCLLDEEAPREVQLDLGFGARQLRVERDIVVEDSEQLADLAFPEHDAARVVSYVHGAGRATLVTSDAWIANLALGDADHAAIAWDLARIDGALQRAWIVRGERPPGLLSVLGRHAWMVLVSAAAVVALGIWRSAARFGPPIADEPTGRREFDEHIAATAEFLLRSGARLELLSAPRRRLRRRIARFRPELAAAPSEQREAALSQSSGLSRERVRMALEEVDPRAAERFVTVVRDLETLRKSL